MKSSVIGAIIILFVVFGCIISVPLGCALNWFGKAVDVVSNEVDPAVLLKKYTWFKECAAELDKKQADIKVYEQRMKGMEEDYKGEKKHSWPRDERETYNQWSSELAGVKASYNSLAAEYNAKMAEIQYSFCNVGDLPKGAAKVLPREFRVYEVK